MANKFSSSVWDNSIKKFNFSNEDLNEMGEWILRQYFAAKHTQKKWFKPNLTPLEALQHLGRSPYSPITPEQLSDMWNTMPMLKNALGEAEPAETEIVQSYLSREKEQHIPGYNQGVNTLSEVSDAMGDMTSSMVNKVFVSATAKLRDFTSGISLTEMNDTDLQALLDRIASAREIAVEEFTAKLKASEGDIQAFLSNCFTGHLLNKTELKRIMPEELKLLQELSFFHPEQIKAVLLTDIEEDDNLFKTFQNVASKRIFPAKPRKSRGVDVFEEEE